MANVADFFAHDLDYRKEEFCGGVWVGYVNTYSTESSHAAKWLGRKQGYGRGRK